MTGTGLLQMRFTVADLPRLRSRVGDTSRLAGLDEGGCEELVLAAYELACDAIRHGGGGNLRLSSTDGFLRCQVSDNGPGFADRPGASGGGLWLAQQLVDEIEIDDGPGGAVVTLLVRCR